MRPGERSRSVPWWTGRFVPGRARYSRRSKAAGPAECLATRRRAPATQPAPAPAGQARRPAPGPARGDERVPAGRRLPREATAFQPSCTGKARQTAARSGRRGGPAGQPNAGPAKSGPEHLPVSNGSNAPIQLLETPLALGLTRLHLARQAGTEVHSESIGLARHGWPSSDHGFPDFVIIARVRQNPFLHSPERRAPFAMTSPMHASTSPDIKVAPANLPLASCSFARHASIARVCGSPRRRSGSPPASDARLRDDLPP